MISVRLPAELEKDLDRLASRQGVSKSAIIRQCLERYLSEHADGSLAWELGKDVFGRVRSGQSDLSRNRKQVLREQLNARRRGR